MTPHKSSAAEERERVSLEEWFVCCAHCGVPRWLHADMSLGEDDPHEFEGTKL